MCTSNICRYEGNPGELGKAGQLPSFNGADAPALLGFDESIDR
jgi:hypothetical protein